MVKKNLVDTDMCIAIIKMIEKEKRTNIAKMAKKLGTSTSKVSRCIKNAREILKVKIKWVPSPLLDDPGWWEVNDYGLLDKKRIKKKK